MRNSFLKRYLSMNRIILLIVGLWPYQQSKLIQVQRVLFCSVLISFVAFQLSRLYFVEYNFDFTINLLSLTSYFIFFVIKYISFWINLDNIRCSLDRLQYIYNGLKDTKEIAIYDKYGNVAQRITVSLTTFLCCIFTNFVTQYWSYIFDIIISANGTYTRRLILTVTRYFAIEEKYFYYILVHINATNAIGGFTFLAAGTTLLLCFKHMCGMFGIASYRFEQVMIVNTSQNSALKNGTAIYEKIIYAVDIHRKAMEFANFLCSSINRSFLLIVMVTVLCVSFNLYGLCQIESYVEQKEEVFVHIILVVFILIYMFIGNYIGQEITDCNYHVFLTAYNVPWYLAPLKIQKLIFFLLQKGSKDFTLNVGGLFTMSLERFASLAGTSISYFTVMLSL